MFIFVRGDANDGCSGELTFSKRFGFLESGKDIEQMMYHTGRAMDYIGIVRCTLSQPNIRLIF
jgi:hypothetical protein